LPARPSEPLARSLDLEEHGGGGPEHEDPACLTERQLLRQQKMRELFLQCDTNGAGPMCLHMKVDWPSLSAGVPS